MKTYYLTSKLYQELKKPFGTPILGTKKEIDKKLKQILSKKKVKKIITVGDYCSSVFFSDIKIFDGKIKRKKIKKILKFSLSCKNPSGTIQAKVWPILRKAIRENKNVFIEGEEDLLVIPCVLLSSLKTIVIYGFPNKGICAIVVSQKIKKDFKEILKKFNS